MGASAQVAADRLPFELMRQYTSCADMLKSGRKSSGRKSSKRRTEALKGGSGQLGSFGHSFMGSFGQMMTQHTEAVLTRVKYRMRPDSLPL